MGIDSGHSLSKQQNKCGGSKTELLDQFIDLTVSVIVMSPRLYWLADGSARVHNTVTTLTNCGRNLY